MTIPLMRYAAFTALLVLLPSIGRAQETVDASSLRLRWEVDPPAHGLQTVCGRVFNDRAMMTARRVRVRVEGVDERGGVTGRREGDVLGQISSRSIGLFCVSMVAGAAKYEVTIVTVDWMAEGQSP